MVNNVVLSVIAWGTSLRSTLATRLKEEAGQDLIEYVLLVGFIAIAAGAAFAIAGGPDFTAFADNVKACIEFDTAGCGDI